MLLQALPNHLRRLPRFEILIVVIRPQFFIPMITLLRNAALNSLQYRQELEAAKHQQVDILCLIVCQAKVILRRKQRLFRFLQMGNRLVNFVNGCLELIACNSDSSF